MGTNTASLSFSKKIMIHIYIFKNICTIKWHLNGSGVLKFELVLGGYQLWNIPGGTGIESLQKNSWQHGWYYWYWIFFF
jgi:hypothetical protein